MVRDDSNGYHYGYVNESGAEQIPDEDVRAFRNGRAAVKNTCGLWGVIDTKGVEIVPCENEKIVLNESSK